MESLTHDSIMSGATSDQQESFSSFRGAGCSGSGGDTGDRGGDNPEQRNAGRERERDRGCSEGKRVQTGSENARFGEAQDASLDSQSSAMASVLSMPSGPAPSRYTGGVCVWGRATHTHTHTNTPHTHTHTHTHTLALHRLRRFLIVCGARRSTIQFTFDHG